MKRLMKNGGMNWLSDANCSQHLLYQPLKKTDNKPQKAPVDAGAAVGSKS